MTIDEFDPTFNSALAIAVAELNRRFFMTSVGGSAVVAREEADGGLTYMRPQAFRDFFANRRPGAGRRPGSAPIGCGTGAGGPSNGSRCCPGVTEPPPGTYNLWRGWGVEPKAGEVADDPGISCSR